MALDRRYVHVNIYNKDQIPVIMKQGPIFNMGMRYRFYEMLKSTPGIIIYTVDEDREMRARGMIPGQPQSGSAKSSAISTQQARSQPQASTTNITAKPMSSLDEEIARRAGEETDFEDDQDIKLNESDIEEIKEYTTSRVYTREDLDGMSKAKLKHILNVERRNQPGSQYYGAFHDRKPRLIEYVLATQEQLPEKKEEKQGE
jgi:hypothetical protein